MRRAEGLTLREFGERVGVSHAAVGGYEPGGKTDKIPADYVARVCEAFGVSADWLLLGRGAMRGEAPAEIPDDVLERMDEIAAYFRPYLGPKGKTGKEPPPTSD